MITTRVAKQVQTCSIFRMSRRAYRRGILWPTEWEGQDEKTGLHVLRQMAERFPGEDFVMETPKLSIVAVNKCIELL